MGSSPQQDSEIPDFARPPKNARQSVDSEDSSVLHSWKEIAAYLHCGVRTAQRWEQLHHLPVHHPKIRRQGPAMALTAELDAWLRRLPRSNGNGAQAASKVQPLTASRQSSREGAKLILSVDDEPSVLLTREAILREEGFEVRSAPDGRTALQIFANEAIDAVLLDYAMPIMDGGMVAERMKQDKPRVPIIMVSAHLSAKEIRCVDCFVEKGEGPISLLETLRRLLASANSENARMARSQRKHSHKAALPESNLRADPP